MTIVQTKLCGPYDLKLADDLKSKELEEKRRKWRQMMPRTIHGRRVLAAIL